MASDGNPSRLDMLEMFYVAGSTAGLVVRSAVCAAEQDAVNLIFLGMQQDRAAVAAGVVHRMIARLEDGGVQNDAD